LSGAVIKVNGVRDEVVKLEACGPACKREGDNVSEAFRNSSHAHIVDKLLFDRIGESTLNVKEKRRCYFTSPPHALDLVDDQEHGIRGVTTWTSSELCCRE
jgi:hypothetical protein